MLLAADIWSGTLQFRRTFAKRSKNVEIRKREGDFLRLTLPERKSIDNDAKCDERVILGAGA